MAQIVSITGRHDIRRDIRLEQGPTLLILCGNLELNDLQRLLDHLAYIARRLPELFIDNIRYHLDVHFAPISSNPPGGRRLTTSPRAGKLLLV
jgi:hypothetical protein